LFDERADELMVLCVGRVKVESVIVENFLLTGDRGTQKKKTIVDKFKFGVLILNFVHGRIL
jgi:hypothetical protein